VRAAAAALAAVSLAACSFTDSTMRDDAVAYAQFAARDARAEMVKADPSLARRIEAAAGWAAFGSTGDSLFARRRGDALGIAHDNRTGKETPIRVNVADTDRAMGLQRYRGLFVFDDAAVFTQFVRGGDLPAAGEGVEVRWTEDGISAPPPARATCRPE
jgi:hypothetical protein